MLVHVPLHIAFDVSQRDPILSDLRNAIDCVTWTLRFDTENSDVPVELCDHYPPRENAVWSPALGLVDLVSSRAWNKLIDRVSTWPTEYLARRDEGIALEMAKYQGEAA